MALKVCMLSSGSKGNSIYITDDKTSLLIDVGISGRDLKKRAEQAEINLENISAVLSTHCHGDHCKGIRTFVKKRDIPVYVHKDGREALIRQTQLQEVSITKFDGDFTVGSLHIQPITLSHDVPHCSGYAITSGRHKASVVMDLGLIDEGIISKIKGSSFVAIESNHDEDMLKNGRYPYVLKRRIMSPKGHLSNLDCAVACKELVESGTKNIMLTHLSEENNLPELAFTSLTQYLSKFDITEGKDYFADIAYQHKTTKIFDIGD